MAIDLKDIFGNQAREEIARLKQQVAMLNQQLSDAVQKNNIQAKDHAAHIKSIDTSGKSKQEHDAIIAEFQNKSAILVAEFEKRKKYFIQQDVYLTDKYKIKEDTLVAKFDDRKEYFKQQNDSLSIEFKNKNAKLVSEFEDSKFHFKQQRDSLLNLNANLASELEEKKRKIEQDLSLQDSRLIQDIEHRKTRLKAITSEVTKQDDRLYSLTIASDQAEARKQSISSDVADLISQQKELDIKLAVDRATFQRLSKDVDRLKNIQQEIMSGNSCLYEIASQINRHAEPDKAISMIEFALTQLIEDDRKSGSRRLNLEMKPLCFVVDVGKKTTSLAIIRLLQDSRGETDFQLNAQIILKQGAQQSEALLTEWVKKLFLLSYPNRCKPAVIETQFNAIARRLQSLLLLNSPLGEIEEFITIDSEKLNFVLPFTRDEVYKLFMPVTGPKSDLLKAIRVFIKNQKITAGELDCVVCLGMFCGLPLLLNSLKEVVGHQVIPATNHIISGMVQSKTTSNITRNNAKLSKTNVQVITSDLQRAASEQIELERWKTEERVKIEQDIRYKSSIQEEQKRQKQIQEEQQRQKQKTSQNQNFFQHKKQHVFVNGKCYCGITEVAAKHFGWVYCKK